MLRRFVSRSFVRVATHEKPQQTPSSNTKTSADTKPLNIESRTHSSFGEIEPKIHPYILEQITTKLNWKTPTQIQSTVTPALLQGLNVIASARAGTGKTGMYAIPLVQRVIQLNKEITRPETRPTRPLALVLVPTSELAAQVAKVINRLTYPSKKEGGDEYLHVYGMTSEAKFENQFRTLPRKIEILVSTPGRLVQHISHPKPRICIKDISILVCDEADKLMHVDMFGDFKHILCAISGSEQLVRIKDKQIVMTSATMLPEYKELVRRFVPARHHADLNGAMTIPSNIKQVVHTLQYQHNKQELLAHLLRTGEEYQKGCLIFVHSTERARALYDYLRKDLKLPVSYTAADVNPKRKASSFTKFGNGVSQALITTDVLARGMDMNHVNTVINYDLPHEPEDYLHRVGRCGRGGRPGKAVSFVAEQPEIIRVREHHRAVLDDRRLLNHVEEFLLKHDPSKRSKEFLLPQSEPIPGEFKEKEDVPERRREKDPRVKLRGHLVAMTNLPFFDELLKELRVQSAVKSGVELLPVHRPQTSRTAKLAAMRLETKNRPMKNHRRPGVKTPQNNTRS